MVPFRDLAFRMDRCFWAYRVRSGGRFCTVPCLIWGIDDMRRGLAAMPAKSLVMPTASWMKYGHCIVLGNAVFEEAGR
jgi:hypothetical protein